MALKAITRRRGALILLVLFILATTFFCLQYVGIRTALDTVVRRPCLQSPSSDARSNVDWRNFNVDEMTAEQMMNYFLWPNRTSCRLAHDFGGHMKRKPAGLDGQKAVCLIPAQVAPPAGNCLVYSFGINNEWSFDDQMERYGCQVYAFDPSMKAEDYDRSSAIHFLKLGLNSRDSTSKKGWHFRSLSSIYQMLKKRHGEHVIDYLKIDIESDEWAVIPQIVESGMLDKIRQLAVEIHLSADDSLTRLRDRVRIIRSIEERGLIRFDSKLNAWFSGKFKLLDVSGPRSYEIAWYNSKFLEK